jgi:hypothetical protein
MFGIALLMVLGVVGAVLVLGLLVITVAAKLLLRVALVPLVLSVGLVKLLVLPFVALGFLALLVTLGPVLFAVVAVAAVPLLAIGLVVAVAWGGLRLFTAI